jgi:hypothetical protein
MPSAFQGGGAGGLNWTYSGPTDSWNYFVDTYQEDSPIVQSKNAAREGIDYIPETSLTLGGNNPYSGALTGNIGVSSGQSVGFNDLFVIFEGAGLDINTDSFDADSKSFFSSLGMDADALVIDMFGEYGNSLIDNGGSIDLASISDLNLNQDVSNHFTIATSTDPEERMQAAKANLLTEIDRQNEKRASLQVSKYYGFETSEVGTNIATGKSYDFGTYGEKLRALDADLEEAETALEDAMFTFMESDGYDNRFHLIDDRPFFIADESTGFEKSSPLYGKQIANPNEGQLVQEANLINDYIFTPVEVDNIDAQQIAEDNKLFDIDEDSLLGTALSSGDKSTFTGRLIAAGLQAAGLSSSMKIYLTAQTWNTVVNTLNAGYNRIANDNIDLNINVNPFEFGAELLKRHFVNADGDPIITDEVEDDFFLNIAANIFSPEYAALNFAVNLIGGEDASFIADSDAPLFDINQSISDFVNSLTTAPVLSQVQKASDQGKFEGVDTTRGTGVRGFLDDVTRFINKGGVTLQKIFSPIISNSIVNGLGLNIEGQPAGEVFTAIGRLLSPKSLRDWARYLEGEGIDPNNIQDADISYYKKIVNDFLTSDKKLENGLTPWEERTNNISEGGYDAKLYTALSNFYKQETGKDFDTAQPLDLLAALQTVSNYNSTYSEADIRNADTAGYINTLNNNYEQFANTSDLEIISDLAFGDSSVGTQETLNGVLDYRDYLNDLPSGQEALSFGEFFISAKEAEFSAGTIDLGLGIYYTPDDIEQIAENVVGIDVINDRGGYQSFSNGLVDLYEYNISDGITGDNSLSQYYINDLETTDPIALRATGTVEEGTYILPDLPTMGYRFDYMQSEADGSGLAYDPISGIAEVFDESRFIDNAGTKNDLYDFRELSADDLLLSNKKITRRRIDDLVKQGRLPLKELVEYVRTNPFEYLEMNAQEFKKSMISLGYATENTIFTFEGAVPEELQDLLLDNTFGSENLTVDGLPENSISPVNLVEAGLFSSLEQAENYLISLPNTVYQGFIYTNKIDGAQLINDPNYGKYLTGELPIPVRSYDYTSQPHITTAYTSQGDAAVDRALRSNANYFLEKIAGGRDDIESLKLTNEIFGGYSGNQRFITDLKNLGYINDDFSINVANAEFFDPNYRETSDYRNAQYSTFNHNGETYVADKNYMFAEVFDIDNLNSDGTYSFRDITKEYLTNYPLIYNPNTLRDAGLQTFGSTQVELFKQLYADGVVSYQDLIDSLGVIEQRQYTVDEDKRLETDPSGGIIGFVSDPANENEESPRNFPEELLDSNNDGIPNFMDEGYVSPTIYDTGEGQIDVSEFIEIPDFDVTTYENIEDLDAGFAEHINAIRDADLNYFREQELSELALLLKNQQERYLEQVGKDTFVDLGIFSVSEILTEQGVLDAYDARLELIRDPDSGLSANQITFEENIAAQIKNNQLAFLGVQQNLNNALQDKFVDLGIFSVIGIDSVEDLQTAYDLRLSQINDLDNGMTPNQRRAELARVEDIYNTKIAHFQLVQDKENKLKGVRSELTNLQNLGRTEDTNRIEELKEQVKAIQEYELPEFVVEDYTSSENPTQYLNDYLQDIEEARATGLISTYNAGLITENIGQFAINLDDLETITIARDDFKAKYEKADADKENAETERDGLLQDKTNNLARIDELKEELYVELPSFEITGTTLEAGQADLQTFNDEIDRLQGIAVSEGGITEEQAIIEKALAQNTYDLFKVNKDIETAQSRIGELETYTLPDFTVEGVAAEDLDGTLSSYQTALDGDLNAGLINQEQYNTLYDTAFNLVEGQKDLNDAESELEILATYELPDFNFNEAMSAMGYNYDVEADLWSEPTDREGDRGSWINEYMDNYENVTLADSPLTEQQKSEVLQTVKDAIRAKTSREFWKNDRNYYSGKFNEAKERIEDLEQNVEDIQTLDLPEFNVTAETKQEFIDYVDNYLELFNSAADGLLSADQILQVRTIISNVKSNGIAAFDAEEESAGKQIEITNLTKTNEDLIFDIGKANKDILKLKSELGEKIDIPTYDLPDFSSIEFGDVVGLDDMNLASLGVLTNYLEQGFITQEEFNAYETQIEDSYNTQKGAIIPVYELPDFTAFEQLTEEQAFAEGAFSDIDNTYEDALADLDNRYRSRYITGEDYIAQVQQLKSQYNDAKARIKPVYELPDFTTYDSLVAGEDFTDIDSAFDSEKELLNSYLSQGLMSSSDYFANLKALEESYYSRREGIEPVYQMPDFSAVSTLNELDTFYSDASENLERYEQYFEGAEYSDFFSQLQDSRDAARFRIQGGYKLPDFTVSDPTAVLTQDDVSNLFSDYEEGLRQDVLDKMLGLDDFFKAIDVAKPIFNKEFESRALPGALDVDYGIIPDDNNEYDDDDDSGGGTTGPTFGGVDTDGILTGNYMAKLDPAYQLAEMLLGEAGARDLFPTGKSRGLADEEFQEIVNQFMLGQAEDAFDMQAGLSDRMQALNEQQTRTQRASDLRLLGEFGDSYRDQIAELYPDANQALTAQREISARSAERARGDLSPTEQAQLEQQSYLFGANRGREYDPITLAQQISEDTTIRDKRDTLASSQQTQLMNMEKGMYGDLMSIIGTDSPFTAGVGNIQTPFNIAGIMDLGTVDYANQQRREEAQMTINQLERDYATARALNKPSEAKSILVQLNEANSFLDNLNQLGSKTQQSMGTVRDIFSGFSNLFGLGSIKPDYDVSSDNDLGYYSMNRR